MTDTFGARARLLRRTLTALLVVVLFGATVDAATHQARLSGDLAQRLASGSNDISSVIVSGTPDQIAVLAARYGARVKKTLREGAVLDVTGGQPASLASDQDVDHLSRDVPVQRMMVVTTEATGATQVWSGFDSLPGYTGRGIGVAVIDSGVAPHSALRNRVIAAFDFTSHQETALDKLGHGTHVAGIIAGDDGTYSGMAPGAHIVSLRVLEGDGSGDTSDVINAIDWTIEHKAQYALRVINLSLGHP